MHWSPEHAAAGVYNSPRDESRAFAHIEFTYVEFLLHRILLKRVGIFSPGLTESSLDIITTLVDTTVAIQTRPNKSAMELSWDVRTLDFLTNTSERFSQVFLPVVFYWSSCCRDPDFATPLRIQLSHRVSVSRPATSKDSPAYYPKAQCLCLTFDYPGAALSRKLSYCSARSNIYTLGTGQDQLCCMSAIQFVDFRYESS